MDERLTCIIAFRNEGKQIELTVKSIRETTDDCPIILINDNSSDGYNYESVAARYNCRYIKNSESKGAAQNKAYGVQLCQTEYFILLDGHMRFYNKDWDRIYINVLRKNPCSIVCANTFPLKVNKQTGEVDEQCRPADGYVSGYKAAYVSFEGGHDFEAKWANKLIISDSDELVKIPCVLGATYGCSKTWWNHIDGYDGLTGWGFEEPLISIKTWLAGGRCLFLRKLNVGHLYRDTNPYPVDIYKINANQIFLVNLFIYNQTDIDKYETHIYNRIGRGSFERAKTFFMSRYQQFLQIKKRFWKDIAVYSFNYFQELNSMSK